MGNLEQINKLNKKKFRSMPYNERAIFIPHCLRNKDCKAKNSEEGWLCVNCGKCRIGGFKSEAQALGYKVFIVPGFSMVKRLIAKYNPKAVLGVSCENEMNLANQKLNNIAAQGVLLSKDGCVETDVDWKKLESFLK